MKINNKYQGLRQNGQFFYCSFPWSLDSYQGCNHNCKYCFSYFNYLINKATAGVNFFEEVNTINIKDVVKLFEEEPSEKDSTALKNFRKLRAENMPIHWGGVSDPFSNFEACNEQKPSLEILKIFAKHQYPVILSTKSMWIVDNPEYMEALTGNKNLILQVSLISIDEKLNKLEPATRVNKRLELIKYVSKTNRVVVRCQPFIPKFCEDNLEGYMETISEAGAKAVTIEFMKLSGFKTPEVIQGINEISRAVGYDVLKFYKFKGVSTATDSELRFDYKLPILLNFKELAHKYGLEFYSADNAMRDYGDSPICCGIPVGYPGFENFHGCNTAVGLFKAKKDGEVRYKDVFGNLREHEKAFMTLELSIFQNLGNVKRQLELEGKNYLDYATFIWDNPSHPNNPAKFYNNLKVSGKDEEGHLIYKYVSN